MAVEAFKFTNRIGTDAGWNYFGGSRDFTEAAKPSVQRQQFNGFDSDSSKLIPRYDRVQLMNLGRQLWQNYSVVRTALNQMAEIPTAIVTPQFDGEDKEWGKLSEAWLYENDKWIDVRGWPFNMCEIDRLVLLSIIRDGDVGELLTEDEDGNPKIQLIPAHRIGSRYGGGETKVKGGPFDGATIIDGVILGDSWDTLGYRVLGNTAAEDRDFSINDMRLHFKPYFTDQIRGYSWLGAAAIDVQDVKESRRLELIAQKKFAGKSIVETNSTGMPDMSRAVILHPGYEAADSPTGAPIAPTYAEEINGGETTYFRAGSNSTLDVLIGDRPTSNQQQFSADVIRQAIHGIGWSVDYALDPSKVGGASMRVVIDTINDTVESLRTKQVAPRRRWVDGWRIAKAVKMGRIPFNAEWFKWEYQFSQRKTADKKYDSDVDTNEFRTGFTTLRDACARRGEWYQDVIAQKKKEVREQLTAAKELSVEFGIPLEMALDRIAMLTPNGSPPAAPEPQPTNQKETP